MAEKVDIGGSAVAAVILPSESCPLQSLVDIPHYQHAGKGILLLFHQEILGRPEGSRSQSGHVTAYELQFHIRHGGSDDVQHSHELDRLLTTAGLLHATLFSANIFTVQ